MHAHHLERTRHHARYTRRPARAVGASVPATPRAGTGPPSQGGRESLLDTTALVHEAYLRIAGVEHGLGRAAQFFRLCEPHDAIGDRRLRAQAADRVPRRRRAASSRSPVRFVTRGPVAADDILRVHEALEELAHIDPRLAQVVEMRYFAGLTEAQIAQALGTSERTVRRDWEKARLLLAPRARQLTPMDGRLDIDARRWRASARCSTQRSTCRRPSSPRLAGGLACAARRSERHASRTAGARREGQDRRAAGHAAEAEHG